MGFWPVVNRVIKEADVVLMVVDARNPELSKNREIDELVFKDAKEMFIVFTKIDLLSNSVVGKLKDKHPSAFFVATPKRIGIQNLRDAIIKLADKLGFNTIKVGVVGYPNVGKSALLNALTGAANAKVSPISGTTKRMQFIRSGRIKVIDSPGVVPYEDTEEKLAIIGAKNPERMKNPERTVGVIINSFLDKDRKKLENYMNISVEGMDEVQIIEAFGRKRGFLSKGGVVDEKKASLQIIRDLQKGKLKT